MKDKKIALFLLSPLTQGGGAEKYFINLAKNLASDKNIGVDVITFDDESFRGFARLLHIFAKGNLFGKIDDYEKGMREKREDIAGELGEARWIESPRKKMGTILKTYDLIYAKNEIVDLALLKLIGYKNLPPIIIGVHTPIIYPETKSFISKLHNILYASFFYKWLVRKAKCVHVSNSFAKDIVKKKFNLKSKLIYYPFSVHQIFESSQENKCQIKFDAYKRNIVFAGRLSEQKGMDVLFNIVKKISREEKMKDQVCINVFGIGDKKYQTDLEKLSEKHSFVRYFGHIENKYMPDILSQQNLMVAPSKWETLPYSILEAQAMGVPVVAFDIPGPNDIIENGKTGLLANSQDDFFEKMKGAVEGKISFDKNKIIKHMENKFNPEKIYSELMDMFRENL
jgi:glycosyltransferase involved in cell wall biosynthesis